MATMASLLKKVEEETHTESLSVRSRMALDQKKRPTKRKITDCEAHEEIKVKKEATETLPSSPAGSDSFLDIDLLVKETCASVRKDVKKIKEEDSKWGHAPSDPVKKENNLKKIKKEHGDRGEGTEIGGGVRNDLKREDVRSNTGVKESGETSLANADERKVPRLTPEEKRMLKLQCLALEGAYRYFAFMKALCDSEIEDLKARMKDSNGGGGSSSSTVC